MILRYFCQVSASKKYPKTAVPPCFQPQNTLNHPKTPSTTLKHTPIPLENSKNSLGTRAQNNLQRWFCAIFPKSRQMRPKQRPGMVEKCRTWGYVAKTRTRHYPPHDPNPQKRPHGTSNTFSRASRNNLIQEKDQESTEKAEIARGRTRKKCHQRAGEEKNMFFPWKFQVISGTFFL